jgi:4-amino-4-deoxy-L-arabinose transferase-like glycosyltransferase
MQQKFVSIIFVCLFLIGACVRVVNIRQPVNTKSWREADVASIARNYYRESMNLTEPRIDWRGDGQGFTESEFPIYPWMIALLYKLFGYHEIFGRFLSYLFSIIALWTFIRLARYLLSNEAAIFACAFYAIAPLTISISTSLQPDGLMFMFYLLAVYFFVRWTDEENDKHYILAVITTAMALLAKLSAAHIGLVFGALLFTRRRFSMLKEWRVWLFGASVLLPSIVWYSYAKQLWLTYGNSLGISNEQHFAGMNIFHNSLLIKGIAHLEFDFVLLPVGWLLIVFVLLTQRKSHLAQLCFFWLTAILIYYLLAANTTSAGWAYYYHVVAVPPIALLLGQAVSAININISRQMIKWLLVVLFIFALAFVALTVITLHTRFSLWFLKTAELFVFTGLTTLLLRFLRGANEETVSLNFYQRILSYVVIICFAVSLVFETTLLQGTLKWHRTDLYDCAQTFTPQIPPNTLVLSSGGDCRGLYGQKVAYNISYMFYWLDRKGFSICREEQTIARVKEFHRRGAKFFIAEKSSLDLKKGFEEELKKTFARKAECKDAYLFELEKNNDESNTLTNRDKNLPISNGCAWLDTTR